METKFTGKTVKEPQKCDTCSRENQDCTKLYVPGIGDLCLTDKEQ